MPLSTTIDWDRVKIIDRSNNEMQKHALFEVCVMPLLDINDLQLF